MTDKQKKELKDLFSKVALTPMENKHRQYLLNLWQEEQEQKEYNSYCNNQPI